jgi:RNA polymerase sigma-32 factor
MNPYALKARFVPRWPRPAKDGGARLSPEHEGDLARRAQGGDGDAAQHLVRSHLGFVIHIARRYRHYGVPMSDLVQEGMVGLVQAIKRFDPARHVRLGTYAAWWIRARMQDYVVRSWSVVRLGSGTAHRMLFFKLRRMMAELKDGAGAINAELLKPLAAKFRLPLRDVAEAARRATGFDRSLSEPRDALDGARAAAGTRLDALADPAPNAEEQAIAAGETRRRRGLIARALTALPRRERAIIRGRYLGDLAKTREVIARELGLSAERVRQLEQKALAKLKRLLAPLQAA